MTSSVRNSDSRSGSGAGSGVASSKSLPIPQSRVGSDHYNSSDAQNFSLPILTPDSESHSRNGPDPEFSGSGVRNRDWLFKFSNPLPIFWKSLPKRLPKRLPIPIGSQNFGIGSENRDLLSQHVYVLPHLLQKPLPILTPNPDPDFFVESHSRFCQKIGRDPKMKFRTLIKVNFEIWKLPTQNPKNGNGGYTPL